MKRLDIRCKPSSRGKELQPDPKQDRVGDADERRAHAGQTQDALLLALDSAARSQGDGFSMATTGDNSKVISYDDARERWLITEAYKLAGDFKPEFS